MNAKTNKKKGGASYYLTLLLLERALLPNGQLSHFHTEDLTQLGLGAVEHGPE